MRNAWLYLKGATALHGYSEAGVRASVKARKTKFLLLVLLRVTETEDQSKSSTDNLTRENGYRWGSPRWDDCTTSKCCLSIFMVRIKLLVINRDNSISVFCHYFTSIKYNFWLHNKYNEICLLSKYPLGWAFFYNLLRDYCFVRLNLVKPIILGTFLTLLLSTMASMQLWLL